MNKEELTNVDIVLYALFLLGGTKKKIFTEDIAKKCFEMAKTRFSWRIYPQFPDIEPVRIALFDAQKKKSGELVRGRSGKTSDGKPADGWIFTPNGVGWINKNLGKIQPLLGKGSLKSPRALLERIWIEREKSVAYKKFKESLFEFIKDYEFTDFLDANLDTPPQLLKERLDEIKAQAAEAKKEDILKFLNQCEQKFENLLGIKNEK